MKWENLAKLVELVGQVQLPETPNDFVAGLKTGMVYIYNNIDIAL